MDDTNTLRMTKNDTNTLHKHTKTLTHKDLKNTKTDTNTL